MDKLKKLTKARLFLPIFCMVLVMAVNILSDVAAGNFALNFFTVSIRNGVLYGRIIDILNRGSEVAILAIGMTLVVSASAGTDISVGSVMSLSASFCCMLLVGFGVASASELAMPLWFGLIGGLPLRRVQRRAGRISGYPAHGCHADSVLGGARHRPAAVQ